jgi:hypothetical protein
MTDSTTLVYVGIDKIIKYRHIQIYTAGKGAILSYKRVYDDD